MLHFAFVLVSTLTVYVHATPTSTCPTTLGPQGVHVRLPPSLSLNPPSPPWPAPPTGWSFKLWSMIYASNPQYTALRNLQYDPSPIDPSKPTGQVNDLTSFQTPGNDTVYTSYGIDTPSTRPGWSAVLDYVGTGILANATSQYTILAWGCDSTGTPYYASYSSAAAASQTPAGIDVFSTSDKGLDQATVDALFTALKQLPNEDVQSLLRGMTRTVQDGGREGKPRVSFVMCECGCGS
jgi:hypothetical protein